MSRRCPIILGVGMALLLPGPAWAQDTPAPEAAAALQAPVSDDMRQLVQQLGADGYDNRDEAENHLIELGVAALPAVYAATDTDDPEVHRRAWHIIDRWAAKGDLAAILVLLEQSHSLDFRMQAIDLLGQLGPEAKPAVPALGRLLQNDSGFVRRMAREALGKIQPMPAVRVEISDATDPVEVGTETIYDIQVTNEGTAAATDLRLVARLPRQLALTAVQAPANNEIKAQRIVFEPITLDPQTSLRYRVHAKALRPGDVRLRVEVTINELAGPIQAEEGTTISARPAIQKPMP